MRSTSSSSSGNNPDARNLPPPHIEAFNEEPFKTLKDSITQKYINDDATRRTLVERCLESPIINVDTNCGFFPEFQKDMTRNYCAVFDAAAQIESEAIEKIKKERTLKSAVVLMGPPGAGKSTFSEQALSLHKAMHGLSSSDGIIIFDRNSGGHYEKELQFMEELTDLGIPLTQEWKFFSVSGCLL